MIELDQSNDDQQYLITRVKERIDEVTARGQSIGADRGKVLEELDAAADDLLRVGPYPKAAKAHATVSGANTTQRGDACTEVEMPDDFLRFMAITMGDWYRPVTQTISPESDRYRKQWSTHTRADLQNPVVAEFPGDESGAGVVLQCFPQDSGPAIDELKYIPSTVPSSVPKELWDALEWEAAARVLQSQRESGQAREATTKARAILYGEQPTQTDQDE